MCFRASVLQERGMKVGNGYVDGTNVSELLITQMACSAYTVSPVLHLQ
jgi:hypothetical protein